MPRSKTQMDSHRYKLQKANFDKEVNTARAEAQLAYELQAAKIQQKIRNEEIQIQAQDFPQLLFLVTLATTYLMFLPITFLN